ncbi:hypothetical protein FNYG_14817 [Fusarium nygamai]|uniref:Uncharacterized protein n=1 Tax=Gibberella nygamai TaxID=42673 RepID=A0A2K0UPZ6_GIBNY|nr:hypothetical protein FNYG_14817 [Fusarium nygamai]
MRIISKKITYLLQLQAALPTILPRRRYLDGGPTRGQSHLLAWLSPTSLLKTYLMREFAFFPVDVAVWTSQTDGGGAGPSAQCNASVESSVLAELGSYQHMMVAILVYRDGRATGPGCRTREC